MESIFKKIFKLKKKQSVVVVHTGRICWGGRGRRNASSIQPGLHIFKKREKKRDEHLYTNVKNSKKALRRNSLWTIIVKILRAQNKDWLLETARKTKSASTRITVHYSAQTFKAIRAWKEYPTIWNTTTVSLDYSTHHNYLIHLKDK